MPDSTVKVNEANRAECTFDDYIHDFHQIYAAIDKRRDVTDVLLNLIMHTSRVSEAVRRNQSAGILEELSEVAAWLLSFVAKRGAVSNDQRDKIFYSNSSMTDIIWAKYPAQCPACLERTLTNEDAFGDLLTREDLSEGDLDIAIDKLEEILVPHHPKPCSCLSWAGLEERNEEDAERAKARKKLVRRAYARRHRNDVQSAVGQIEEMFRKIYQVNVQNMSLADITFHLQEEVGEVAEALVGTYTYNLDRDEDVGTRALYNHRLEEVDEELADVFSWMYSLLFKIRATVKNVDKWWELTISEATGEMLDPDKITLPAIIWVKYGEKDPRGRNKRAERHLMCARCRNRVCDCNWLIARSKEDVNKIVSVRGGWK